MQHSSCMAWSSAPVSMVGLLNMCMSNSPDIVAGYDAGIMTVILADTQFTEYYNIDSNRQGVVATIPWASTGIAQLFAGGMLANWLGRIWTLRLSILFMCLGVYAQLASHESSLRNANIRIGSYRSFPTPTQS